MQEKIDKKLQQIAEKALTNSVVRVEWQNPDEESGKHVFTRGSGFFVGPNRVVTNLHCVAGAPSITAEIVSTEATFPVEGVVAYNINNDLVILKVAGEGVPLSLGNSDNVQIGDNVCAVGHPRGAEGEATQVTIHGIRKSDKRIQIKEALAPGHSGSALLNSMGEVIGISVGASLEITVFSGGVKSSLSHAIPANVLNAMLAGIGKAEPLVKWQRDPLIQSYAKSLEGQAQMMQQKHEEAMACFDAALEINPNLVEIYANRAGLKILMGEAEEAVVDCDSAIKLNPDFAEAHINRAAANLSLDQHNAAIADCDAVLKLNPDFATRPMSSEHPLNLVPNLIQSNTIEALADYNIALKLNPNAAEIYFARAHVKDCIEGLCWRNRRL